MFISLSQARYNVKKIGTSTVHSNIIYLYSDPFNLSLRVNMCILIDYLSRHSFGHFLCRGKGYLSFSKKNGLWN